VKKVTPFLWFDGNAEEAARFYAATIPASKVLEVMRPGKKGPVQAVRLSLAGQEVVTFNGGPYFKFNESFSLLVLCKTQGEIDRLWKKLTQGGQESRCGWLKDKYGLSWQIVPEGLWDWIATPGGLKAMMGMKKLVIAELKKAAKG
jgi:predicted 3-demethylubiquinone-9 3-methyltransferase (glyoxalase superfamily)